jgi:hypothetical protein
MRRSFAVMSLWFGLEIVVSGVRRMACPSTTIVETEDSQMYPFSVSA